MQGAEKGISASFSFAKEAGENAAEEAEGGDDQPVFEELVSDAHVDGVLNLQFQRRVLIGDACFHNQVINADQQDDNAREDKSEGDGFKQPDLFVHDVALQFFLCVRMAVTVNQLFM